MSAAGHPDFEQLFDALPVPAFVMASARLTYCNAAMAKLLATTPERLIGREVWELIHPDDREKVQTRYRARLRGELVTPRYEFQMLALDGTRRRVEMTATAVDAERSLGLLRDVGLFSQDTQLVAALSEASSRVQRARSVAGVIDVAIQELERIGLYPYLSRYEGGRLVALPPRRESALFQAVLAQTRQRHGVAWQPPPQEREKLMGAFKERVNFVDDFRAVNRYHLRAMGLDVDALEPFIQAEIRLKAITSALIIDEQFWGTLTVSADQLRPSDVGAVALFTGQVASALEVAHSLESLRQTNRQLAAVQAAAEAGAETDFARLVPRLLRIVAEGTGSPLTSLYLHDGAEYVRVGAHGYREAYLSKMPRKPEGPGTVVDAVLKPEQPQAFAYAELPEQLRAQLASEGLAHAATLPLLVDGTRIGAITLGRTDAARPFLAADLEAGKLIAGQVVIQIEKARLIEAERRRVHDLQLLFDVARVITASLDPEEILEAAAANIARLVDATDAFIWLYDPATHVLRGETSSRPEFREHFRRVRLDVREKPSAAGMALQTGKPVRVLDVPESSVINQNLNATYQVKSLVALPLLLRDEAIGAVTIGDRSRERPWTESEVERAQVMASQVAVAVANGRLFADLKQSYEKLAHTREELVKRERLAALGELSAVVAHEVRNPLGVIFNALGALRRAVRGNEAAEHLMGIVGEEADRLNHIVSDLLDFARPHEPALRQEEIPALLLSAREAALAITGDAVEIALEMGPALPTMRLDARMLRQALINLLVNAAQASARGGPVVLRADFSGDQLRIGVSDRGAGIAPALRPRIFEPFFTTKATGTGLGLAVVKRIVEAHRGEVQVESVEGRGTTFTVQLPLQAPASGPAEAS